MSEATVLSTIPSTPAASEATEVPAESPETAAPAEEAVAAPEVAEVQPDVDLEIARKLDSAAKREARARKQEAEIQRLQSSLKEQQSKLSTMLEEFESDPLGFLTKNGKDPVEVAKRFAKPASEEEKRIAKLEAALKEREDREKQLEEAGKKRHFAEQKRALETQFVRETDPEEYPYLTSIYQPHEVPSLVGQMLNRPADSDDPDSPTVLQAFQIRHGRLPTNKEIRDALEHEAESRAKGLLERFKPKEASQVTPETSAQDAGSPSISNQHAAKVSTGSSRKKSREERLKELTAQLEAEQASTE